MQNICDIRIVGIDDKRPPRVRKEPYIDLFFKLSQQAPEDWCEDFNKLTSKQDPAISIDKQQGLYIDTYVRDMSHIPEHLEKIKKTVIACNSQYLENIQKRETAAAAENAALQGEAGKQGKLNTIIAALQFDD